MYFKTKKNIRKYDIKVEYKANRYLKVLHYQAAQQVLISVPESFKFFNKLKEAFNQEKITDKPNHLNIVSQEVLHLSLILSKH